MLALDKTYLEELDEVEPTDESLILDAKYEATSPIDVASKQDHLSKAQKEQLAATLAAALADTKTLFDGKLGHYKK